MMMMMMTMTTTYARPMQYNRMQTVQL